MITDWSATCGERMAGFEIELSPRLASAPSAYGDISLENLDYAAINSLIREEYDVHYVVFGRKFGYYPASIITVLSDIFEEHEQACNKNSHLMTLSGYTVLGVDFVGDQAQFFDPAKRLREGKEGWIGERLDAGKVKQVFKSALDDIWFLIQSHQTKPCRGKSRCHSSRVNRPGR